jgi:ElaB/YqjD/DUF883 family membrane-anchored ribosome-binding protein
MANTPNRGSTEQRPDTGMTGSTQTGQQAGAVDTLKEKARDLTSGASDIAGQVRGTAQEWAQTARSGAEQAWDSSRQFASNVADRAGDALEGAGNFVRRYPVATVLCAFGAGFLLRHFLPSDRRWS